MCPYEPHTGTKLLNHKLPLETPGGWQRSGQETCAGVGLGQKAGTEVRAGAGRGQGRCWRLCLRICVEVSVRSLLQRSQW